MDHRSQCKMQNYKTPRTGENLGHFGFLDTMSKACSIKEKVNVMDYITLKKNFILDTSNPYLCGYVSKSVIFS